MRFISFQNLSLFFFLAVVGCSDSEDSASPFGTAGGTPGTGGGLTGGQATGGQASGGGPTGGQAVGGVATGGRSTGGRATGGAPPATGGQATGGAPTGGAPTGGQTGGGGITTNCTDAEREACGTYQSGQHCGLTFEIWTDGGTACMTNTPLGFRAYWNEGNANYLARKGVRPGSASPIVTYSADYQPNGNSYLAIYGWTQNPLIEYYIVDSWGSWRPPGTAEIGTVVVDGGTYQIYRSERVNQPSIEGTKTFWQYWSVRTEKRTSGTITVGPHFAAWADFGLTMGSFYEVSLVIEGYHSSGEADVQVMFE